MLQFTQVVATEAAPTHSVDVVVAIAGIVGTLLGIIVGAVVTWKIQQRQLEHEDETRFHDRRLAVYAEFNDACGKVVSAKLVAALPWEHLARVISSFETLRLVASKPVYVAAIPVHGAVADVANDKVADLPAFMPQFNASMAALGDAMRAELGVANQ